MRRRVLLLVLIMAVPVLTALGTQQLASTTDPPTLPSDPVSIRVADPSSSDSEDHSSAPPSSSAAPEEEAPDDAEDEPDEVDLDTDSDGEQDDAPESGTVAR